MNATMELRRGLGLPSPAFKPAPTVLIVDEDRELASLLSILLGREGFVVHSVGQPSAALRWLYERQPDVAIVNLENDAPPELDSLRAVCSDRQVPLVFLSQESEGQGGLRWPDVGVDDYLIKPLSAQRLVRRLWTLVSRPGD